MASSEASRELKQNLLEKTSPKKKLVHRILSKQWPHYIADQEKPYYFPKMKLSTRMRRGLAE